MTDELFVVFAHAYLLTGFVAGFFIVCGGKCESPVGTWIFATFTAPLFLAVSAPFLLLWAVFAGMVRLLGIEAATEGNDR